jgi:hypothetical protein
MNAGMHFALLLFASSVIESWAFEVESAGHQAACALCLPGMLPPDQGRGLRRLLGS